MFVSWVLGDSVRLLSSLQWQTDYLYRIAIFSVLNLAAGFITCEHAKHSV